VVQVRSAAAGWATVDGSTTVAVRPRVFTVVYVELPRPSVYRVWWPAASYPKLVEIVSVPETGSRCVTCRPSASYS
jgi:hypothetical protein